MALRPGQVVNQPIVGCRVGKTLNQIEIQTPCCSITYRIDVEEITRFYIERTMWIKCGKLRHQRGRTRPDSGCDWPYDVSFVFDTGGAIVGTRWKVGRG